MKIWLMNHYAGNSFFDRGGRHYSLAKYLKKVGYDVTIFCSNAKHFGKGYFFDNEKIYNRKIADEINVPYVFVKSRSYVQNDKNRILNMIDFYRNVKHTAKIYSAKHGKPDIIYASSVHPLTLVAGIQIAKKYGIKCISEVRDLWPESIVAYSSKWTRGNLLMRILYAGEKWIYMKSDHIIMTWAGGYDYIRNQGWEKKIAKSKVTHISNGVDLKQYIRNIEVNPYFDKDLSDSRYKTFIYTGSIRKVNNLQLLVSAAEILKEKGNKEAKILLFGDGDELERLAQESTRRHLDNIVFKGRVEKQYVPSILSQGYVSVLHNSSTILDQYGQSQNKFFEYLAAGHPILMTYSVGHSVVKKKECGLELDTQNPEMIARAIQELCDLSDVDYQRICDNAKECSKEYDYVFLCKSLVQVINENV